MQLNSCTKIRLGKESQFQAKVLASCAQVKQREMSKELTKSSIVLQMSASRHFFFYWCKAAIA